MEEKEELRANAGGWVCAHLGIGADDAQAKVARDRLANALAAYRARLVPEAPASEFEGVASSRGGAPGGSIGQRV
ncbi:hypothetical protein A8924_6655 [Saccharopolyspora erythraea NRRL 2338]|uniref:Uncharacterized protein n=2 Tax=Saccharopolyspora erythraea TaxID=1836 RepID=A4FN53_SACEN|nr:hypothetical protein [Saccharopolyspora erythraea]EQD84457.1 hypothetical protein N599_19890 [Saccharopolyspora erythraea D]PFG99119.1 hypothetical protein A8924_6655 [Saccharopolyspora erythraea NRRL 2338]QRK89078.1 hypothetical protein JQX30_31580 [Saccharopolyspora erythraea]CAM05478.1 hypothetical protein SACE_6307 [Saccharopolyspora erythraea NRRL 2338]